MAQGKSIDLNVVLDRLGARHKSPLAETRDPLRLAGLRAFQNVVQQLLNKYEACG